MEQKVIDRAREFCAQNGLSFATERDPDDGDIYFAIGLSTFCLSEVSDLSELQDKLDECLRNHVKISNMEWKSGILYHALHNVGDDCIKAGIEDEIGSSFDKEVLDKIAQIFYKYTTEEF